jgi:hypothetical protein
MAGAVLGAHFPLPLPLIRDWRLALPSNGRRKHSRGQVNCEAGTALEAGFFVERIGSIDHDSRTWTGYFHQMGRRYTVG